MNNNTSQVREASKKMSEENQSVLAEIKNLQEVTASMQECMTLITDGTSKINQSGDELNSVTPKLIASIDEISNQIDQFKV